MLDDAFVTLYFLFKFFCFVFIFKMKSVMEPALIHLPRLTGQSTSRSSVSAPLPLLLELCRCAFASNF